MNTHGLGSWLRTRRLRHPHKDALVFAGGERMTYAQLADAADRASAVLRAHGIRSGDRVAYFGENSPDLLVVLFGAVRIGAVFVPLNTRLAPPEIAHMLSDSDVKVLVHETGLDARLAPAASAAAVAHVIPTGATDQDAMPGLHTLMAAVTSVPAPVDVEADDAAVVVYTSGTTGTAKGAVLTHGNLTWVSLNTVIDYDIVSSDVSFLISPLFHVAALGMGALPAIMKGATVVIDRGFDAGRALDLIERHRVTMVAGVPTTYQLMADHPAWAAADLSSLRVLTCGGSAVPPRVIEAYEDRGLSFTQGYGMTETSPGATSLAAGMTRAKQGSVGLPHFFTEVRVVTAAGAPAAVGELGEIVVRGPNVFAGYLGLSDATAAAFADGWFRSGDLGRLDEDGYLYIADRLKDMIISGGENIYPAEVEGVMAGIEGITGVAVLGIPDERWGEVPVAVVTLAPGARIDIDIVRAALAGRIARYKIPTQVVVVDELPRTASGKIRKNELRERLGTRVDPAGPVSSSPSEAASTPAALPGAW